LKEPYGQIGWNSSIGSLHFALQPRASLPLAQVIWSKPLADAFSFVL
jgi:hypothetical protein